MHKSILSNSTKFILEFTNVICIIAYYDFHGLLQVSTVNLEIWPWTWILSHKQEKISISRKLKKAHLEEQKEKKKKENEEILKKIKSDRKWVILRNHPNLCVIYITFKREQLEQKKEVAEQLYENPYGKRFTSNEIQAILNAEEEVSSRETVFTGWSCGWSAELALFENLLYWHTSNCVIFI